MPVIEINKVLNDIYDLDINLTTNQIRKICTKEKKNINKFETTELEEETKKKGGIVKIKKEHDENGKIRRTAILCIDDDEYHNLISTYGNPMFIDGTAVPNRLNWELTMITLVDKYLGIQPGGAMFSLNSNKETFDWFLKKIMKLIKQRDKVTIISDEDHAICSSIKTFNSRGFNQVKITHVLCAWHKEQNFYKKLAKCGFDDEQMEHIKYLWKRICNSPKKSVVLECINEMKQYDNHKLTHYIDKHIIPILNNFARAFIPEFTAGYNVSSLAESANSLLKRNLTASYFTLNEIKDTIRRAPFSNKSFN